MEINLSDQPTHIQVIERGNDADPRWLVRIVLADLYHFYSLADLWQPSYQAGWGLKAQLLANLNQILETVPEDSSDE